MTILRGKVEEVVLPVDKVDIIISEWMVRWGGGDGGKRETHAGAQAHTHAAAHVWMWRGTRAGPPLQQATRLPGLDVPFSTR